MHGQDTTINRKISANSSFFKYLIKKRIVSENPFDVLDRNRIDDMSGTMPLNDEEASQLLSSTRTGSLTELLHRALLHTFFKTALRKAEVQSLKVGDFYIGDGYASIKFTEKGGLRREKRISQELALIIIDYLEHRILKFGPPEKTAALFVTEKSLREQTNKPISTRAIDNCFDLYKEISGIKSKLTPHVARATYIRNLLDQGLSIYEVASDVGHKDIKTTDKYSKRMISSRGISTNINY